MPGIEALLLQAQFRWVWHVVRMSDNRIPKQILFVQLASEKRLQGRPVRRYKDALKQCGIRPESLSSAPLNRALEVVVYNIVFLTCCDLLSTRAGVLASEG